MGFDRCRLAYIFARSIISRLHLTDWRLLEIQFFFLPFSFYSLKMATLALAKT